MIMLGSSEHMNDYTNHINNITSNSSTNNNNNNNLDHSTGGSTSNNNHLNTTSNNNNHSNNNSTTSENGSSPLSGSNNIGGSGIGGDCIREQPLACLKMDISNPDLANTSPSSDRMANNTDRKKDCDDDRQDTCHLCWKEFASNFRAFFRCAYKDNTVIFTLYIGIVK